MLGKISVVNVKGMKVNVTNIYYIGRKFAGWEGSVLGNPFIIGQEFNRNDVIRKYEGWLRSKYIKDGSIKQEIDSIVKLVKSGKNVTLGCWCHPAPCHGDVIKRLVEELIRNPNLN